MKTLARIFGIAGLILFIFGIISFVLTQANSAFFYVHIFGGLALILFYFIYLFRGTKEFLGLMLLIIFSIVGAIIIGTFPFGKSFLAFVIPLSLLFVLFIALNLGKLLKTSQILFFVVPALIFTATMVFKKNIPIDKNWVFIFLWGAILAIVHLIMNFKNIRHGVFGKSTKYAVNVLVYSFIFLIVLVVLNILSFQIDLKKDLTENKINLLSEQSVKIVKNLKQDVNILAFFIDKNKGKAALKNLLGMYTSESNRVKVEFIDPDLRPQVAKKYNAKDGDIVIECDGEEMTVKQISEETITTSIIQITKTKFLPSFAPYLLARGSNPVSRT